MSLLDFASHNSFERAVSPFREMAAYEALWTEQGATFKTIADKFRHAHGSVLPSELVPDSTIESFKSKLKASSTSTMSRISAFVCMGLVNTQKSCVMRDTLLRFSTIRVGGI